MHHEPEEQDLDTVTALLLQAKYLLSISSFSHTHAVISEAASLAMRMGLHLDDECLSETFTTEQLLERRRVFAVTYYMDIYTSGAFGLPRALRTANVKQMLGLPDEAIYDEGRTLNAEDPTSWVAETVLVQKLMRIYAKISQYRSVSLFEIEMTCCPNTRADLYFEWQDLSRSSQQSIDFVLEIESDLKIWQ
jgi:hypothetical protein